MTGCRSRRQPPPAPPPEVAPLPFDGPDASMDFGRAALCRRMAPLLRPERPDDSAVEQGPAFRHARQACGALELHGLVLGPCLLRLDASDHACLVVPLAGEAMLRKRTGRRACLLSATDQGAALMPPGGFQISCHNWISTMLIPLPMDRLIITGLALATHAKTAADARPPSGLDRRLESCLERAWQWSASDSLQGGLLGLLRQTLRLLECSGRTMRHDFPPPGWHCDALLLQTVALLLLEANGTQQGSDAAGRERRLDELIAHIEANLHRPLTLADLSARSGWSSRTLQYAFRERFGCGPMQWVRRQRLEAARTALEQADPGEEVVSIAWRCGYTNLSSFSRDILATFGCSPSMLRRCDGFDGQ
jgi:AraC-like DNA-binding protein